MQIMAVSVSQPIEFEFKGRTMRSSIFKQPVNGPVALGKTNLAGDGLTLADLDPDFIPRINKRLRAFKERTE